MRRRTSSGTEHGGVQYPPQMARKKKRRGRRKRANPQDGSTSGNGLPEGYGEWWDENFAFIAGRTEGGAAYGTTWEEVDEHGNLKEPPPLSEMVEEYFEEGWDPPGLPPDRTDNPDPGGEIPF